LASWGDQSFKPSKWEEKEGGFLELLLYWGEEKSDPQSGNPPSEEQITFYRGLGGTLM